MGKELLRERIDELKECYDNSLDQAKEVVENKHLGLTDDDIIAINVGDYVIVESAMNTILMWFSKKHDIIYNNKLKNYIWHYIDEQITFDELYDILVKESDK